MAAQAPVAVARRGFIGSATLRLTAGEVAAVRGQLFAVIKPYVARLTERSGWPAGYRFVCIMLAGTPGSADPEETSK
jgi:hypothetical protein